MQGRLSPSEEGRLQFFPKEWQSEFWEAEKCGFGFIEWVWDWLDYEKNPLLDINQLGTIRNISSDSCVMIPSLCADYFLKNSLLGSDGLRSVALLGDVMLNAYLCGVGVIGIPFLEDLAIRGEDDKKEIISKLYLLFDDLEILDMKLALETELPGDALLNFIDSFKNPRIGVCYDTGNCVSLGHDVPRDIGILGRRIFEVHIKDRLVGSRNSVFLGTGHVDFVRSFRVLQEINFSGPMILQAFRGSNYLYDARGQAEFVRTVWRKATGEEVTR